jgi:hypothetical protein
MTEAIEVAAFELSALRHALAAYAATVAANEHELVARCHSARRVSVEIDARDSVETARARAKRSVRREALRLRNEIAEAGRNGWPVEVVFGGIQRDATPNGMNTVSVSFFVAFGPRTVVPAQAQSKRSLERTSVSGRSPAGDARRPGLGWDMAAKSRREVPKERNTDPVDLKLDAKNPRFAIYPEGKRREKEVIRYLLDTADLRELIESIAANGYVTYEPLIVLDEDGDGTLTVIEGNRRVAALKLLRDPDYAADLGVTLPPMRKEREDTLTEAKILEVESRDEARQYIGFKHINGPHKWDSFAKAKFAAQWYRDESSKGITIGDIAHRLGDRHDTILRLVNGILVLEQAEKKKLWSVADRTEGRKFAFSHLYTALTRGQYRDYLGLPAEWRNDEPEVDPVKKENFPKLKQVLVWMYGSASDEIEPLVTSQNPHIKNLGEVLAHPAALKTLETTGSLAKAHDEVMTRSKKFEEALVKAVKHAETAQSFIEAFDGDVTLVEFGSRLVRIGKTLVRSMKGAKSSDEEEDDA